MVNEHEPIFPQQDLRVPSLARFSYGRPDSGGSRNGRA